MKSAADLIRAELTAAHDLLTRFLADDTQLRAIEAASEVLLAAFRGGHKAISCGNGGSMCDAMHFAEELTGRYRADRPGLAAIALSDASYLTCVGNDYGYEQIFARGVRALGRPADVFVGISTSGNSANVLRAAEAAREIGMRVIILSGKDGGKLAGLADVEVRVPHFGFADRVQEIHIKVIHLLILLVERGMGWETE
ncbi:MAG: D-sedoheptulose 7-phosphate isomerase [Hymenobacteraceae bacterium]|nr:D-sedoheptulose 7-phosphate isomerase [Hymenobacteraceae bacterium]